MPFSFQSKTWISELLTLAQVKIVVICKGIYLIFLGTVPRALSHSWTLFNVTPVQIINPQFKVLLNLSLRISGSRFEPTVGSSTT